MIAAQNPWKSYRQISTQTAPPGQLVLMLFDAALHSLERALPAFDSPDPGEKNMVVHNNLQRASDIVCVLNDALNLEAGGELAATLRRLYFYIERRLIESNRQKQPAGTEEAIGYLKELREAWAVMLGSQSDRPDSDQEMSSVRRENFDQVAA